MALAEFPYRRKEVLDRDPLVGTAAVVDTVDLAAKEAAVVEGIRRWTVESRSLGWDMNED